MVKVAHIALVNLIAGRRLVPELLQKAFTPENVELELRGILSDPVVRVRLNQEFGAVRRKLGGPGASARVAEVVLGYVPEASEDGEEGEKKSGQLWG